MAIKNTSKMIAAMEIMHENKRFEGIDLESEELTNAMICDLMHAAGYSWDRSKKAWWQSPYRREYVQGKANEAVRRASGHQTVQIRLMGAKDDLKAIADDFREVADLIGLDVLNMSQVKALREGGDWGRIYITARVR